MLHKSWCPVQMLHGMACIKSEAGAQHTMRLGLVASSSKQFSMSMSCCWMAL
jgi:hypothetical protein